MSAPAVEGGSWQHARDTSPHPFLRRVKFFADNCAGTNKSQFAFGALALSILTAVADAFAIQYQVPGHTKFESDVTAQKTGTVFNRSDCFNHGMLLDSFSPYVTARTPAFERKWWICGVGVYVCVRARVRLRVCVCVCVCVSDFWAGENSVRFFENPDRRSATTVTCSRRSKTARRRSSPRSTASRSTAPSSSLATTVSSRKTSSPSSATAWPSRAATLTRVSSRRRSTSPSAPSWS